MVQMRNPTEVEAERNQSLMIKIQAWDKLIRKQLVMGGKRAFLQLDSLVEFPLLSCGLEESCSLHAPQEWSVLSPALTRGQPVIPTLGFFVTYTLSTYRGTLSRGLKNSTVLSANGIN